MASTPTLALPRKRARKRERERTALTAKIFRHNASRSIGRSDTRSWSSRPLSRLRGEGWGGGKPREPVLPKSELRSSRPRKREGRAAAYARFARPAAIS